MIFKGLSPFKYKGLLSVIFKSKLCVCASFVCISAYAGTYKYDYCSDFHEGLAMVMKDGKCGFIDTTGTEIIPLKYAYAWDFSNGMARVAFTIDNKHIVLRQNNYGKNPTKSHEFYTDYSPLEDSCVYGFIDKTGKMIVPVEFDYATNFRKGYAIVSKKSKYGLLYKDGSILIPLQYDEIGYPSESLIMVKKNGKKGFIDMAGNIVIPLEYDICGTFSNGLAIVKKEGKSGYIDKNNKLIINIDFDDIYKMTSFNRSGYALVTKDDKPIIINREGDIVYHIDNYLNLTFDDTELIIDRGEGFVEIVDTTWQTTAHIKGNGIQFVINENAFVISQQKKRPRRRKLLNGKKIIYPVVKYGIKDRNGNLMAPIKYDEIWFFADGLAVAKNKKRYGYLNEDGIKVIPLKYRYADSFSENVARVFKWGKCGYIDKYGQTVIPFEFEAARSFHEGFAAVKKNGKWGFININGKEL